MHSRISTSSFVSSSRNSSPATTSQHSFINTTNTTTNLIRPSQSNHSSQYHQPHQPPNVHSNKQSSSSSTQLQQQQQQKRFSNPSAAAAAVAPDMPDLSHLSEDERRIIEAVFARQRAEEEQDTKLVVQPTDPTPFRRNSTRTLSETTASTTTITRLEDRSRGQSSQRPSYAQRYEQSHEQLTPQQRQQQQQQSMLVCSQRHSISDIAQTVKQRYGGPDSLDTGAVCDLCKVTKFASAHAGGRVCSACKSRCCLRCSLRFTVPASAASTAASAPHRRQLLWICVECKRKHEEIMRSSAEWPAQVVRTLTSATSPPSSKPFTSDYILNKTEQPQRHRVASNSVVNGIDSDQRAVAEKNRQSSTKRQLPNVSRVNQQSQDDSIQTETSLQSVPDLARDEEGRLLPSRMTNDQTDRFMKKPTSKLKQALIKQVSLNNPPSYYRNLLNDIETNSTGDDYAQSSTGGGGENESLYGGKSSNTKSFTSNQELLIRKTKDQSRFVASSSPQSSNSQLNLGKKVAEKLQDPLSVLRSRQKNPSQSNHSIATVERDEQELYELARQQGSTTVSASASRGSGLAESPATMARRKIGRSILIEQRSSVKDNTIKKMLMQHNDSMSSVGSDPQVVNKPQDEDEAKSTASSSSKRLCQQTSNRSATMTTRKQPVIPPLSAGVDPNAIKNKLLLKFSSKQHSLTSSDEDLSGDDVQSLKDNNKPFSKPREQPTKNDDVISASGEGGVEMDEEDEEEENYDLEEEEEEEEMRSMTECTDEMDLESVSAANARRLNRLDQSAQQQKAAGFKSGDEASIKKTLIDDYLGVENMEKEEILAAKINKFLSPTNWQPSSDGKKLIGYVVLKRNSSNPANIINSPSSSTIDSNAEQSPSSGLGLRIVGGKTNPFTHQLSAYIVKVRQGSTADLVGGLQVGDEVVKWNRASLRGLTYDEVYSIMSKSRQLEQVELVVERILDDVDREKLNSLIRETKLMIRQRDSVDSDHQISNNNNSNSSVNNHNHNHVRRSLANNENQTLISSSISSQQQQTQQQLKQLLTSDPNVDNNYYSLPIGKLELKILHDSLDNKLYVNLLAINLSKQFVASSLAPSLKHQQRLLANLNDVESLFCKLNLLTKKKIELFSKLGQTCHRSDECSSSGVSSSGSSGSNDQWRRFDLNEAFTFEPLSVSDLGEIYAEIEVFNNRNKQVLGKATLDLGSSMFDNQLLNLNVYTLSGDSNSSSNGDDATAESSSKKSPPPKLGATQPTLSIESNNSSSGVGNVKRRQLPQIPLDKQKESRDKIAIDLVEKARKLKLENLKESRTASSANDESMREDEASVTSTDFEQSQPQPQQHQGKQQLNEAKSETSMSALTTTTPRRKMPQMRSEQKSSSIESASYETVQQQLQLQQQQQQQIAQKQQRSAHVLPSSDDEFATMLSNHGESSARTESRRKMSEEPVKFRNIKIDSSGDLLLQRAAAAAAAAKLSGGGGLVKNSHETTSKPELVSMGVGGARSAAQQQQIRQLSKSSAYLSTSAQSINEESLYLNNSGSSATQASGPGGAQVSGGSANYAKFQQLSNPALNRVHATNTRPEKLFSASHINQIKNSSNRNINKILNGVVTASGIGDIDSDGSDNSLLSQASKMSSQSGPPEFLKGGNQAATANGAPGSTPIASSSSAAAAAAAAGKKISGLTTSDPNRLTTVSTHANNSTTTTTTTVINNASSYSNLDQMFSFTSSFPTSTDTTANATSTAAGGTTTGAAATTTATGISASSTELMGAGVGGAPGAGKPKRRPSMAKALVILGLSKKSNSASNLTLGKRFGFARSEEYGVMPELRNRHLSPPAGSADGTPGGEDKKPKLWSGALKLPHEQPFSEFIDKLGPGQKVSRQALGLPCLGEIKLSLFLDHQKLNIEIIEIKNLKQKTGYKILPNIYVKFYLLKHHICTEKQKTSTKRRTLTPTYQETLKFESDYRNSVLQVIVWGDYGKLDRKVFMGMAQITLDDCDVASNTVVGWYKFYPISSIITDYSMLASVGDLTAAESEYSLASQRSVK